MLTTKEYLYLRENPPVFVKGADIFLGIGFSGKY